MVEAPNKLLDRAQAELHTFDRVGKQTASELILVLFIAERQIAELRAERDKANAWAKEQHAAADRYAARAEALEAENARLRALPLKDEVERVLEPIKNGDGKERSLLDWLLHFKKMTESTGYLWMASDAAKYAALLSRLRAGEQEGWRSMDSAPKDGTPILAIGFYSKKWGDIEEYIYEGEPNFWHCSKRGVCIRPDYAWRYRWMPKFDLPPLPANPKRGEAK